MNGDGIIVALDWELVNVFFKWYLLFNCVSSVTYFHELSQATSLSISFLIYKMGRRKATLLRHESTFAGISFFNPHKDATKLRLRCKEIMPVPCLAGDQAISLAGPSSPVPPGRTERGFAFFPCN